MKLCQLKNCIFDVFLHLSFREMGNWLLVTWQPRSLTVTTMYQIKYCVSATTQTTLTLSLAFASFLLHTIRWYLISVAFVSTVSYFAIYASTGGIRPMFCLPVALTRNCSDVDKQFVPANRLQSAANLWQAGTSKGIDGLPYRFFQLYYNISMAAYHSPLPSVFERSYFSSTAIQSKSV